jgi:hypothetical protein
MKDTRQRVTFTLEEVILERVDVNDIIFFGQVYPRELPTENAAFKCLTAGRVASDDLADSAWLAVLSKPEGAEFAHKPPDDLRSIVYRLKEGRDGYAAAMQRRKNAA